MVARASFAPELVTVLPWDDERSGIPSSFTDYPMLAWYTPEHARKVRTPVRVRLDDRGGFHVLGDASPILHLDDSGAPVRRTPLPEGSGRVVDYACDTAGNCVLLEHFENADAQFKRLRALDPDGAERWSRDESTEPSEPDFGGLNGHFTKILYAGDRLYLPGAHGRGVAEVDAGTGEVRQILPQRAGAGASFLGGGRLLSVFFDDDSNRRGIAVLDPDGAESVELTGTPEHYAWLVYPFGADRRSRLYVWRNGQVARLSLTGDIEVLGEVNGIAVRTSDGSVFTSRRDAEHVVVSGEEVETRLPAPPELRLVHVDADGRFHLLGGEAPGNAGELRVYSPDGRLESTGPPPEDLATIDCRLPTHTAWQVDAEGRVNIPVVTPDGVAIVRLRRR